MRYSPLIRLPITDIVRAGEWWEYKLVPIFAAFYATAFLLEVPVFTLWPAAITILLALVPGAAYVSVINDLTDEEDDLAAGKRNRMAGASRPLRGLLAALPVAAGLVFAFLWRRDTLLLSFYLAAWLAFSLYSLPPFRWKARGILGVIADASGAHLFPTLVAVLLTARFASRPLDATWLVAIAVWSFAYGLRGILWHQLTDRENDRAASVRTFAVRHPPHFAVRLGTFVAFPLELAALAFLFWRLHSLVPVLLLAIHAALVMRRVTSWKMNIVIVDPRPHFLIALHEFYDVFFPLGILIAASLRDPRDLIVVAVHLLLFPRRARLSREDAWKLIREWR